MFSGACSSTSVEIDDNCDDRPKAALHRSCLPGCGCETSAVRDIETIFLYRQDPFRAYGCSFNAQLGNLPVALALNTRVSLLFFGGVTLCWRPDLCEKCLGFRDISVVEGDYHPRANVRGTQNRTQKKQQMQRKEALRQLFRDFEQQMKQELCSQGDEVLFPMIRVYLPQQGVRQTMNSGYAPVCHWVAYVHTHRVTETP